MIFGIDDALIAALMSSAMGAGEAARIIRVLFKKIFKFRLKT